jgi:hypothetical protein
MERRPDIAFAFFALIAVACSGSDDAADAGTANDAGARADSGGSSGASGTSGMAGTVDPKDAFFNPPAGADKPVPDNSCIAHCTEYKVPGKIEDVPRAGGVAWTDVANAASPDGTLASVTLAPGQESDFLYVSDFGFDFQGTKPLTGVTVALKRWAEGNVDDAEFTIVIEGHPTRGHLFAGWPKDVGSHHYGQAVDPWGDTDIFPADVTTRTFGAHVAVKRAADAGAGNVTAHIDAMRVAVCYCNPDGK